MFYYPGENWYALRVKYQYESVVEKALQGKNFQSLNLAYKAWSRRKDRKKALIKPFFPGYMFVRSELDDEKHVEILKCIGIIEILKNREGPIPIPEDQIENVLRLKKFEGEFISLNEFAVGMKVKVIHGPLKGVIGFVDTIERDLIKVGIDAIPGSIAIHVNPAQIEPVERQDTISLQVG